MKTITLKSKQIISTGATSVKDFNLSGYQSVTFFIRGKSIGVSICGFDSKYFFTLFPKTKIEIFKNDEFLKMLEKCENNELIKKELTL